ncbi:MAG: aminotransferase class I/II-fold pyridoxal phosphate-dependent enzyme [Clostridia bacterium]|nr:aminotransferase class I/II-fold pyridoxal phosphate-dependent enzyme [Clostridia bacterium]
MRERMNTALYGTKRSAIREFTKLAKQTPGCMALTLGEPDFDTPEAVRAAVTASLANGETHYIENNGLASLRETIAEYERVHNGMDYTADEIILTAGATEALFTALFGILNPGDEVIIPAPAFVLYEEIVKLCRATPVFLDTKPNGFQIDAAALGALVNERTKAIVLNTPNNPTGCVYDNASLEAVYAAVKERDIFVVCDDVYRALVYTEDYHSFAEYRDLREKLLVVQSFSKPYAMTGWRVGYLMADAPVKERLELVHQYCVVSTPAPFQKACIAAIESDVTPMRETYRKRRAYVLGRLRAMGLEVPEPDGAFYVFPSIAEFGMTSAEFCRRMIAEAGLAATPGSCFGTEGHIRLTYCYADDVLKEGLDRLERFVGTLRA